jgi:acyl carrier protein
MGAIRKMMENLSDVVMDENTEFAALGLNSIQMIHLIVDLEQEYDIEIEIEKYSMESVKTIGMLAELAIKYICED